MPSMISNKVKPVRLKSYSLRRSDQAAGFRFSSCGCRAVGGAGNASRSQSSSNSSTLNDPFALPPRIVDCSGGRAVHGEDSLSVRARSDKQYASPSHILSQPPILLLLLLLLLILCIFFFYSACTNINYLLADDAPTKRNLQLERIIIERLIMKTPRRLIRNLIESKSSL